MARPRGTPVPTHHKASGQDVVRLDGKDHYLGPHGTPEAAAKYHRLMAEWISAGQAATAGGRAGTVAELMAAYTMAEMRARPESAEIHHLRTTVRHAATLYGDHRPEGFEGLELEAVRQAMIDGGLARKTINQHVTRIKRIFAWGEKHRLISKGTYHGLLTVRGLRRGQGGRETPKRRPVPWAAVEAIRPHVGRQVWAMVGLQWLTGMRPGEVVIMTTGAIDMTGEIWAYDLGDEHKTAWLDQERIVQIGPSAQEILGPWLRPNLAEYLFQPAEAVAEQRAAKRAARETPLYRSHARRYARQRRFSEKRPKRPAGRRYTVGSYRRAVQRACDAAGVERWTPHQLRHSFATRVRKRFNLDAARAALGHAGADVTLDYAELDRQTGARVAREIG